MRCQFQPTKSDLSLAVLTVIPLLQNWTTTRVKHRHNKAFTLDESSFHTSMQHFLGPKLSVGDSATVIGEGEWFVFPPQRYPDCLAH